MKLYLFDGGRTEGFAPFALTRPVGELLFGCLTLRERAERVMGLPCSGHVGPHDGFEEVGAPVGIGLSDLRPDEPITLLCGRTVLDRHQPEWPLDRPNERATLVVDGRVAGWVLPPGEPRPLPSELTAPEARPGRTVRLRGWMADDVWTLMGANSARVSRDIPEYHATSEGALPEAVTLIGGHPVSVGRGVEIEPHVVLDASKGPIRLDDGVRLCAYLKLTGPAYIGPRCVLFGGSISGVSFGPVCKVRGEVEETVILGYTNKAHDGFLGHAYLGRWVNLGALTTNSDLKNNYGAVRLRLPSGPVDTGLKKVGCFLGDHVKTGIGTMINTGTVVGAGSNLFGGVMPPSYVPPFSWGSGADLSEYRLDKFLEVADVVMSRRNVELSEAQREWLSQAWKSTAGLRADAFGQ